MLGSIKGYEAANASKRKLEKEDFTRLADSEEIRKRAYEALEGKGKVYLFRNSQKQCVCCFILQKVKGYTAPEGLDTSANGKAVLVLEKIFTELDTEIQEQLNNAVLQEIKELICFTDINAVQWNNNLITVKDIEREIVAGWYLWIPMAFVLSMILDSWIVGLGLGIIFAGPFLVNFAKKEFSDGKKG